MEMTWNNMEKKEKLMWIKKAAEDQKRYEVRRGLHVNPRVLDHKCQLCWDLQPIIG